MTVTIEQAQASLQELVDRTARGEKVLITRDNKAVAQLVPVPAGKPNTALRFLQRDASDRQRRR